MGRLLEAAHSWNRLNNVKYILDISHKGKLKQIELTFLYKDFPHAAGMQYAKDVDFGVRAFEIYGERLIPALLNGYIDDGKIEKGKNWERISFRLNTIIKLQELLDSDFIIMAFDKRKVPGYSTIEALYVIKSEVLETVCFVFLDERSGRYYCKSAFEKPQCDYTINQTPMTILQKIKITGDIPIVLFNKPGYKAEPSLMLT